MCVVLQKQIVGMIGLSVKERLAIAIKQIVENNKASFAFPSSVYLCRKKMIAIFYLVLQLLKLYSYVVIANVIISWLIAFQYFKYSK